MGLPIKLPKGLARAAGKIFLKVKARSPEACVVGGILLGGAALVMTGINTWKGKEELSEDVKLIQEAKVVKVEESEEETKERKKELSRRRVTFIKHVGKRYWLPVALGVSSAGLVWGGRTLLRKELSAMTALAATLSDRYKKFYDKVSEEFGEEKAQELAYGAKVVDAIDGETGEVKKKVLIDKKHTISPYAVYFDQGEWDDETCQWIWKNHEWKTNKLLNIAKIKETQSYFNDILDIRGWVLWGEVADYLGLKPDPNWYRVGWKDDPNNPVFIELGVLEGKYQLEVNKRFTDEDDPTNVALIDPNVQGCLDFIFEDIEKYDKRCGKRAATVMRCVGNKKDRRKKTMSFRRPTDDSKEEVCIIEE